MAGRRGSGRSWDNPTCRRDRDTGSARALGRVRAVDYWPSSAHPAGRVGELSGSPITSPFGGRYLGPVRHRPTALTRHSDFPPASMATTARTVAMAIPHGHHVLNP